MESQPRTRALGIPLPVFYVLFTVSGFAGLIYESIWSHYLKLLLGHAAYAQTLVLAIFMGGMAIGAALAGRSAHRIPNLLLAYAAVEIVIGACALAFHGGFVVVSAWLQGTLAPALGSPLAARTLTWAIAAASILPQSILLGMTFPFMTGGILRRYPAAPGRALASLYCANSLGAAVGVLASGLWLVGVVGLPGTLLVAGCANIVLAITVWALARSKDAAAVEPKPPEPAESAPRDGVYRGMLAIALVTGASSFVYEVCWIRLLSLVLGSATHSFEIMLSAFILGLALGGYWIRSRIDRVDTVRALALAQIVMGLAALASLPAYGQTFGLMEWLLRALTRTDHGYVLFLFGGSALVMLVMLPATFCAGMTLPLITHLLLGRGCGERSIGAVYAANTVGAILGVAFAINIGMPLLGIRNAITVAAALDLALGVGLLAMLAPARSRGTRPALVVSVAAVAATLAFVRLDPYQMASGVYRYGRAALAADNEILYQRDGKTATISLISTPQHRVSIMTNGKPDAAINMRGSEPAPDEVTMVLAAALPLALRPDARTAANIGMGSGLTTSTLLASTRIERVDTIEIERAIIDAARGFKPRVARAYDDPRSRLHVEDAKSYFAANQARYDIIVSEPSNPWVSGVSSLFSREFYASIRRYLNPGGVLVQWLQAYEIDLELIASVIQALSLQFADYVIYSTDNANLLVIAANDAPLDYLGAHIFESPVLAQELARVGIAGLDDLNLHRLGDRRLFEPLMASFPVPANSDYFPFVDQRAARTRFLARDALELVQLTDAPLPVLDLLDPRRAPIPAAVTGRAGNLQVQARSRALALLEVLTTPGAQAHTELNAALATQVAILASPAASCDPRWRRVWFEALFRVAVSGATHLRSDELDSFWAVLGAMPCAVEASGTDRAWLALLEAVSRRRTADMLVHAQALLESSEERWPDERLGYLLTSAMLAHLAQDEPGAALAAWESYGAPRWNPHEVNIVLRLLTATAVARSAR